MPRSILGICINFLGLPSQHIPQMGGLQIFLFSPLWSWEVQDRGVHRLDFLKDCPWLADGPLLAVYSCGLSSVRAPLMSLPLLPRTLVQLDYGPPVGPHLTPVTSWKSPNTVPRVGSASTHSLGEDTAPCITIFTPIAKWATNPLMGISDSGHRCSVFKGTHGIGCFARHTFPYVGPIFSPWNNVPISYSGVATWLPGACVWDGKMARVIKPSESKGPPPPWLRLQPCLMSPEKKLPGSDLNSSVQGGVKRAACYIYERATPGLPAPPAPSHSERPPWSPLAAHLGVWPPLASTPLPPVPQLAAFQTWVEISCALRFPQPLFSQENFRICLHSPLNQEGEGADTHIQSISSKGRPFFF